jgi:hypothetical protein
MTDKDMTWEETREKLIDRCKAKAPDYYKEKREGVEKSFVPGKADTSKASASVSPSNKYTLVMTPYATKEGCWNYTRGEVYLTEDYVKASVKEPRNTVVSKLKSLMYGPDPLPTPKKIGDIKRNYGQFPFAWIEGHADGHDYLVCGEDYQAVSIIQLDTCVTKHTLDPLAVMGAGWCPVRFYPSPNKQLLAVSGCGWACPFDIRFYDLRNPMELPWPLITTAYEHNDYQVWDKDSDVFSVTSEQEIRKSDGKPTDDLTEEEYEALENSDDDYCDYVDVTISFTEEELMQKMSSDEEH